MELEEVRTRLIQLEAELDAAPVAAFATFQTPHGELQVAVTARLRQRCQKGRVWKSAAMLTALKNAAYGFDRKAARSRGGADGIFSVDRNYRPANSMMKKLFAQFLDKPDLLVETLKDYLQGPASEWFAVRLVSHHLRLLGLLSPTPAGARLVLVDYDDEKGA